MWTLGILAASYLEDGSILVWPAGEHCLVLVGYSSDSYYFNDPQSGKVIEFKAEIVESVFKELGSRLSVLK